MNFSHSSLDPVLDFLAKRGAAAVAFGDGSGAHYAGQHRPPVRSALEAAVRLFADAQHFAEVRVYCGKSAGGELPSWRLPNREGGERIVGTEPMAFSIFGATGETTTNATYSFTDDFLGEQKPATPDGHRPTDVNKLEHLHVRVSYLLDEFAQAQERSLLIVDESYFRYTAQFPSEATYGRGDDIGADRPPTSKLATTDGEKFRAIPQRCAESGVSVLLVFRTRATAEAFKAGNLFLRRVPQLGNAGIKEELPVGFSDLRWEMAPVVSLPAHRPGGRVADAAWLVEPSAEDARSFPVARHLVTNRLRPEPDPLEELREMEGMGRICAELEGLLASRNADAARARHGINTSENLLPNFMLMGNPGTGKTTVARIIARCLLKMGLVGRPFVEAGASGLIAGFEGQTGPKTAELCASALGGVLFIDEAYALADSNTFGKQCIAELLRWLEGRPLVCIAAGYSGDMQRLVALNDGVSRRFGNVFTIEDYSPDMLCNIARRHAQKVGMEFAPDAVALFRRKMEIEIERCRNTTLPPPTPGEAPRPMRFSNGGFAVGVLKSARQAMELRLQRSKGWDNVSPEDLRHITAADVAAATFAGSK